MPLFIVFSFVINTINKIQEALLQIFTHVNTLLSVAFWILSQGDYMVPVGFSPESLQSYSIFLTVHILWAWQISPILFRYTHILQKEPLSTKLTICCLSFCYITSRWKFIKWNIVFQCGSGQIFVCYVGLKHTNFHFKLHTR